MPLEKESLNNFLPDGFETNNLEGAKENFSADKIATGYEKDVKDRVSGPNFNNLLDVIGKNTNVLTKFMDFIKNMPINNLFAVDENNQLVYKNLDEVGGGGLEIGDIAFTQMAVDETKGKRRVLNGQIIIQEQYASFTNKIKNSVALNADLACTEEEWQTAITMSTNGICYKFVIDDDAGTIRLPKYPQYLDLTINTSGASAVSQTVSVYGNGMTLGLTDNTSNYGLTRAVSANELNAKKETYGQTAGTEMPSTGTVCRKTSIGVTKDASKSGLTGKVTIPAVAGVTSEKIKGTYFIQVATGAETEDNIINEIELNNPYSLGDSKYSPKPLNNLSWLKSEGQWNSKADYPSFYDWALTNFNNGVEGFASSTGEYTDYDVVINSAEETFRLPLLDGSETMPDYNDYTQISSVGTYVADKNCYVVYFSGTTTSNGAGGALSVDGVVLENLTTTKGTVNTCKSAFIKKGQSYTLGSTANFRSCKVFACKGNGSLYFYVGETVQNANLINAGRIQEKVAECITRMDCKAYVTETYVNGTSGYRVWSDKYCEQWGRGTTGSSYTGTYLKPFINTDYNFLAVDHSATSSDVDGFDFTVAVSNLTTTGFRLTQASDRSCCWRASGYIA